MRDDVSSSVSEGENKGETKAKTIPAITKISTPIRIKFLCLIDFMVSRDARENGLFATIGEANLLAYAATQTSIRLAQFRQP